MLLAEFSKLQPCFLNISIKSRYFGYFALDKASLSSRGTDNFFASHDCLAIVVISSGDVAVSDEQVPYVLGR